jgi:hypothetical protein
MSGTIVFFGRNPAIMALVERQIRAGGHTSEGLLDEAAVEARLRQGGVSLLVLGGGVEDGPRERCRALCRELNLRLLEHFGGPEALSRNITEALIAQG